MAWSMAWSIGEAAFLANDQFFLRMPTLTNQAWFMDPDIDLFKHPFIKRFVPTPEFTNPIKICRLKSGPTLKHALLIQFRLGGLSNCLLTLLI